MSYLLRLMLKEEFRMHAHYSSPRMFLAFPVFVALFSFAIGITSQRILEVTPLAEAILFLHLSAFLYGLGVGAFGFLGAQYLERRHGHRNYLVAMPALLPMSFRRTFLGMYMRDALFYIALVLVPMVAGLSASVPFTGFRPASIGFLFVASLVSFLLGMSLSFFASTLFMRSRVAFSVAAGLIAAAFAGYALFRLVPVESILPGLAMHYGLPPFAAPGAQALTAGLVGAGLISACVAAALLLVPDQYEPRSTPAREELPRVDARLRLARSYGILLAKEFVDLKRSGTIAKMFFSFVTPLILLSLTAWFVRHGLRVPVGFNSVFYGAMVGFFGVLLYNWLNNVDAMDHYETLPVRVPTVIRSKLLAFLVLTTGISTAFVVGVSALNGDLRLLWLALPVMFVTSVYMVVMTAYLTGLRTNSFLFDAGILAQFSAMAMLPDLGLTILSFTVDRDPVFTVAGIALVLAVLAAATLVLYRGIDGKWDRAAFTE
jgi:MFS family permease